MLNDGWNEGLTAGESDAAAAEMYRDAHPCCLECEQPGCLPDECPSSSCDLGPLVVHEGELMHAGCVAAFDRHTENKCDGTTCHCAPVSDECGCEVIGECDICAPAPDLIDDDEGVETARIPYEPMKALVFAAA